MKFEIQGIAPLLQVFDMPASLRFYRDVLGFEVVSQSQPESGDDCDWALLRLKDAELMLNTAYEKQNRPSNPDSQRNQLHADLCMYFFCYELDELYEHLQNNGLKTAPPSVTSYGFKALSVSDPDGFGLCFHHQL